MLKKGSKGTKVETLQIALTRLGYFLKADGDFGSKTLAAVKAFQTNNTLKADGIVGPITQGVIDVKLKALGTGIPAPAPVSPDDQAWMIWLERNKGQKEIAGSKANQFIVDTFQYTSLKNHKLALSDETAWCAALANAALRKNGMKGTNSAAAKSFDKYGEEATLDRGMVVTTKNPKTGQRHVTFCAKKPKAGDKTFIGLGGNQGNALKESTYQIAHIVAIRKPVPA